MVGVRVLGTLKVAGCLICTSRAAGGMAGVAFALVLCVEVGTVLGVL